ncbi:type ISP restriction/modification enzyme [Flavobacterium faecale]|uniref:type ISP restriction/modification enzyme n=1 Tax=Flavobacterium faecale TaxID=1355330 RepID=UPI003AAF24B0
MLECQSFESKDIALENIEKISKSLGLPLKVGKLSQGNLCFVNNREVRPEFRESVTEIEIIDYCYALYHSSKFWKKIGFQNDDLSQYPLPTNDSKFWKLVSFGAKLRQLHLKDSIAQEQIITQFPLKGNNKVLLSNVRYSPLKERNSNGLILGNLYINETQYFKNVPEKAWDFRWKKEKPAQRWLQDQADCVLTLEAILEYQNLIAILTQTATIIEEIKKVDATKLKKL